MSGSFTVLLDDLRRRGVFKVAAVYGAVGYALVQIADVFVPALLLPEWIVTATALAVILGFPIAIVVGWFYQFTSTGLERDVAPRATPARARGRTGPAVWVLAAAAVLGTVLIFSVVVDTVRDGLSGRSGDSGDGAASVASARDLDPHKLAVLPFESLGGVEDRPFALGVHDDILTRLQRVQSLKVMTRNSVLAYAETELGTREIAGQLGAGFLLTGAVQRSGDRLRVNVHLADASADEVIWTDTFDEVYSVDKVLDVQTRIAEQVAGQLRVTLTAAEREALAKASTRSLQAYELFLGAESAYRTSYGRSAVREAIREARRAVEIDPDFGLAWALIGLLEAYMHHQGFDRTEVRVTASRQAIDRALEIDPDLPEAHTALGFHHYWTRLDYDAALEEFGAAERVAPSSRWLLTGIAAVRRRQGRMELALDYFQRARELEPNSLTSIAAVGETLRLLRRFSEAADYFALLMSKPEADGGFVADQAFSLLNRDGAPGAALAAVRAARERGLGGASLALTEVRLDMIAGDPEAAVEKLDSAEPVLGDPQYIYYPRELVRGWALRQAGDSAGARAMFEIAADSLEAARERMPDDERVAGALGLTLAALGMREEALGEAARATRLLPIEKEAWRGATHLEELARVHAELGNPEEAVSIIEDLLARPGELTVTLLRLDPRWEHLRGYPSFEAIVRGE